MAREVKKPPYGARPLDERVEDYLLSHGGERLWRRVKLFLALCVVAAGVVYLVFNLSVYRMSARMPFGFKHTLELYFSPARKTFFEAEKDAESGRSSDALAKYYEAVKEDKKLFAGYARMGEIYLKLKEPKKALASLKNAYAVEPYNYFVCEKLGEVYIQQKKYARALLFLNKAVKIAPWEKDAYFLLGRTYEKLGEGVEAIEAYETSITKLPVDSPLAVEAVKRMKNLKRKVYP